MWRGIFAYHNDWCAMHRIFRYFPGCPPTRMHPTSLSAIFPLVIEEENGTNNRKRETLTKCIIWVSIMVISQAYHSNRLLWGFISLKMNTRPLLTHFLSNCSLWFDTQFENSTAEYKTMRVFSKKKKKKLPDIKGIRNFTWGMGVDKVDFRRIWVSENPAPLLTISALTDELLL